MNAEELRHYALSLTGASESFPFGNDTIVFKVKNKIFLLFSLDAVGLSFNVKCDPDTAVELREMYECITAGYHMNKKHWNTIHVDGTLSNVQLKKFIEDSYDLVSKNNALTYCNLLPLYFNLFLTFLYKTDCIY